MTDVTSRDWTALLPEEIAEQLDGLGEPAYRGEQVFTWIHDRRVDSFEAMSNLPKVLRQKLGDEYSISRTDPTSAIESQDGSTKLIFDAGKDGAYSAVVMPTDDRVTLCISSQVGCKMGCRFCLTGRMGFRRSLTAGEIVGQVHAAARFLGNSRRVSNVVFMGMGEPMDNFDEVLRAVRVLTHRKGMAIAPRRTTVSTVGSVPGLTKFIQSGTRASVALSLCAMDDQVRGDIVPMAKKYDLASLFAVLASNPPPAGHFYTIEYLLLDGFGDSDADARALSRSLARFPAKVNLIPFNPWPGAPFDRPSPERIESFRNILSQKNHRVTVRLSRGQDIGAACGQMSDTRKDDN